MKRGNRMAIAGAWCVTIGVGLHSALAEGRRPESVAPWDQPLTPVMTETEAVTGGVAGVGPGSAIGANHIVDQQCPNGGWGWPHDSCSATYNNITGPIGMGLLRVYGETGDAAYLDAATAAGDFDLTFEYTNSEARFGAFTAYFLWNLSAATGDSTYSDHAAINFFDELTVGTYGPDDLDTAGWIAAVQTARTGTWVNLRPWEFHNLIPVSDAIGNVGQSTAFIFGTLDGLSTLDNTDPSTVYSDLVGLSGGVRGVAFAGLTSFTPISAPNHAGVDGISTLKDLADLLVSYQNADGSWYWHSDLSSLGGPTESDKDTQTTAYAVLALIEADAILADDYSANVAAGRDWLRSMQLADGGFMSYPGGSENTEVEGEALDALAPDGCTEDVLAFVLASGSDCVQPGETVTVELHMSNLQQSVQGYQAFGQFDSSVMMFVDGTYTPTPFALPTINPITATGDDFNMAAGVLPGGSPTSADSLLVTLNFTAGATEGTTVVSFRENDPPNRFSDAFGADVVPCLIESPPIVIDGTAPSITCPADVTIECDEDESPANTGMATATDGQDAAPSIGYTDATAAGSCDHESTITRTWTATDCAGNETQCVQTITIIDSTAPALTCPDDVTISCDESTSPSVTGEPGHFQGFEDPGFTAPPITSGRPDWQQYESLVTRVSSGSNGITSKSGSAHAEITPNAGGSFTGAFSRLGGYSSTFNGGFVVSLDAYMDLSDPAVGADTYGWDLSVAASNQSGNHLRDFIFHTASNATGDILVGGSNNTNFTRRNDLASINHHVISASGWYTFEWDFHEKGDGSLEVDLNLRDAAGTLLWTETRNNAADDVSTLVGGNRYMWFTFLETDFLAIDNTTLSGIPKAPDNCDPAPVIGYTDAVTPGACPQEATITRTWTAEDDCGNVATCQQTISIEDDDAPMFTSFPADVTIECDESTTPAIPYGTADGGVAVYYNDNGGGENAANRAFLKLQIDGTKDALGGTAGAPFLFDNSPLSGATPITWHGFYSGLVYPDSQFGLDFVVTMPTSDGSVPTPVLNAYDNVDNTVANRLLVGPVTWAINDYKPHVPDIAAGDVINSLVRSQSPGIEAVDIEITQLELSSAGPIQTMDIAGTLTSDGIHHWYTPSTPDSPMSNFNLNGTFYFTGSLTYDSTGDAGTDLINFFEGTITLLANSPNDALGFPLAADNCDPLPAVFYNDDLSGLTGCNGTGTIVRTWTAMDACGNMVTQDQIITVEDSTDPVITCPADVVVNAEAGGCTAAVTYPAPTATDACGTPTVVCDTPSGSTFSAGTTLVTCTVTDDCGNSSDCSFNVTVNAVNELVVDVELGGGVIDAGPFERCITFELWDCPGNSPVAVEEAVLTFTNGFASGVVEVPCGDYSCITARDRLHTLRRTDLDDFGIVGTQYVADFTDQTGSSGDDDSLISVNLNDDFWIDILDFGVANAQWLANYGTPDTSCATPFPHADVNGDGVVNNAEVTFVLINFLTGSDLNCCGADNAPAAPVVRISVKELRRTGRGDLAAGDLNHDGWLDEDDIAAFLDGARPTRSVKERGGNGSLGSGR